MKNLSSKWQKLIIWVTGYLSIIAFVIGGGYIYMKTEDADVKKSAKTVFLISIAFTALDIIFLIIRNITSAAGDYQALNVISIITSMIAIVEAIVFVVFCALDMVGKKVIPVEFLDDKQEVEVKTEEVAAEEATEEAVVEENKEETAE
ncbi:MAG: hypothetical protein J6A99_02330 [Clostridia bacterium]|nr:hypothetical protein [Clostridia bacterium]